MLRTKRFLTVLLAVVMILQTIAMPTFALDTNVNVSAKTKQTIAKFTDFPKSSWSTEALTAAVENGLLVGTSETKIEPRKNLTRAEFAAIITRAFGATQKADISNFKDVKAGAWYVDSVAKAVQMGVMNGTGATTFAPNAYMKREDVILALARVLFVDGKDASVLSQFSDRDKIDTWSVAAIAGMVKEGYVNGYEDGTIRPQNLITREELAQLFHNIFKTYISAEGTVTSVAKKGSVIVRSKDVTLKDVTIYGDLVMADGIGDGDFRLENVAVTGKILARGGEGTCYFVRVASDGLVIINDPNGVVNFHNYRDDAPFHNNLLENTPATFLERKKDDDKKPSSPGGTTGGTTKKYSLTFYDFDGNPIDDGVIGVKNEKGTYKVRDFDVPTNDYMYKDNYEFVGWTDGVETKTRSYFISKNLSNVDGKWYPVYVPITVTPDEYEITFVTPTGDVPVTKTEGEKLEDADIPSVTPPAGFTFEGWSTSENDDDVEFTNDDLTAGNVEDVFSSTDVTLYPVYKEIPVTYSVAFKYVDGSQALPTVTKELLSAENYVLTDSDVYDVAHPTAPADYRFIGWTTTVDGTDYATSQSLRVSIKTLATEYYAQFEEITVPETPVRYSVEFKHVDDTEALPTVTKELLSADDYVLTEGDVYDLTKTGYNFLGWTTTVDGTDYISSAELRVSIKTLGTVYYAQFEEILDEYTITFVTDAGDVPVTKTEGETLSASEIPEITVDESKEFLGWSTTENDDTPEFTNDELTAGKVEDIFTTTDVKLYPVIKDKESYSVIFKPANDGETDKEIKKYDPNYVLTDSDVPADPSKAGFTFEGWSKDENAEDGEERDYFVGKKISEVVGTWYPIFKEIVVTPDEYEITFVTPTGDVPVTKTEGEALEDSDIPEITVDESKEFLGWSTTENDDTPEFTNDELTAGKVEDIFTTTDVKLYPVIKDKESYSVIFKPANDGETDKEIKKYDPNYVLTDSDVPADPSKAGFTFEGWSKDENAEDGEERDYFVGKKISEVVGTWYPIFKEIVVTPDEYTITFVTDAGDVPVTKTEGEALEDSDIPSITPPAGFTFEGWSTTENDDEAEFTNDDLTAGNVEDVFASTNVTLYPVYKEIPETPVTYTVKFLHVDGSRALAEVTKQLLAAEDYVLTDTDVYDVAHPTAPADYEFLGWTEDVDGTDYITSAELQVSIKTLDGKTYYAQFKEIEKPVTYKVEFKYDNGSDAIPAVTKDLLSAEDFVLTDNEVYDPAHPTSPADYRFIGWTTTVDGTDYVTSQSLRVSIKTLSPVYYAQFEEITVPETPVRYTVEFMHVDGTTAIPAVTKELLSAEDYVLTSSDVYDVILAGKTFLGWTTTVDGTDYLTSAQLHTSIKTLSPVYYAQFEDTVTPVTYKVIFKHPALGDVVVEKEDPDYLFVSSDVPSNPSYPHYIEFRGWSQNPDAGMGDFRSDFVGRKISELVGIWYPITEEEDREISFDWAIGDDFWYNDYTYIIQDSDIPVDPTLDKYDFLGWAESVNETDITRIYERDYFIGKMLGDVHGSYHAVFQGDFSIEFKFGDGSTALPLIVKTLRPHTDYTLTIADVVDVQHPVSPIDYRFLGWTTTPTGTDYIGTNELVGVSIKELGTVYYAQFEKIVDNYSVVFKYTDGTEISRVEKALSPSENYILTASDVYDVAHPTAPADYRFLGWTTTEDGTDYATSQSLRTSIKSLGTVYYAQFEEITVPETPVTYTVEFKYLDGSDALAAVTKSLLSTEDYVLTESDVYDATMSGFVFLGWTTTVDGTDYISSDELRVSIKSLSPVYYAQFEEEPERPVTYTVEFKYTDDTAALPAVTKDLLSAEDYVLAESDVYDVDYHTTPEDYEFLGWTTTVDGADYKTSAELRASIKTLSPVYYAQFKHIDDVEYYVEHYFEQLDGSYVLDTTETLYEKPGTFVTAIALTTLPDGYEGENTSHPDRVAEGTIPALPDTLTLKLYYDLEIITVTYMELGDVALTIDNGTEMIYAVKYGGTIDNFYDPADDTKTNEEIKAEIANFIEYNTAIGYGKDYDDEYLYNEFEAKDTDGDGVADEYDYYNKFGKNQYEHEINFNWYVEDAVEEYVLFDVAHVFTSDLDIHSKVKKLNIVIGFPAKLTDEVLTLNVPYEETTRFLDSIRDALFINENIAEFPEMTGVEDKFYEKLSQVGGKFFDGEGPVNEDRSLNNTDVLVYFYLMMGGKEKYKDWLWNEVEDNLLIDLGDVKAAEYNTLRSSGLNQQKALYKFFEEKVFGETPELATKKYFASKEFIRQSTEEKTFEVNEFNEFIMEKVDEKIRSLSTLDAVIDEYIGDKIPEGLLNRLPMEIVENAYETRVAHFLEELEIARYEASHGHPGLTAHSGIEVDVNLVAEIIKPIAEFAVEKHEALVNKAKNSSNRGAELFYKYYGENPYASALVGNYGKIDLFFVEKGNDTALADKYGHLNSSFNNLKKYKIETFENIYKNVVMPLSVETIDALLWYMDPEGGAVEFSKIRSLAEDNEDLILALYNHPNKLMAKYAEEGLPEDMIEYYNDLLSDPDIKAAVEKIDNKVDFDMMFFVEEKLQNATLEVYYLKVLDRVGVPVQNILDKYTNSKAYKELTHADFVFYLDELEKAWETVDGIENYNATTDYVFENVLEKVGNTGDKAQASIKGFEMIITRFFADYIEQPAD